MSSKCDQIDHTTSGCDLACIAIRGVNDNSTERLHFLKHSHKLKGHRTLSLLAITSCLSKSYKQALPLQRKKKDSPYSSVAMRSFSTGTTYLLRVYINLAESARLLKMEWRNDQTQLVFQPKQPYGLFVSTL